MRDFKLTVRGLAPCPFDFWPLAQGAIVAVSDGDNRQLICPQMGTTASHHKHYDNVA